MASRRNVDIPEERTELVAVLQIDRDVFGGKLVTEQFANEIVAHMRTIRDSLGAPNPESIDSDAPNRIFHVPISV